MKFCVVREEVNRLLGGEGSGHGADHSERVERLALAFAQTEKADGTLVSLIALLHDADDYKLFGKENAEALPNARRILALAGAQEEAAEKVLSEIKRIGYSKALKGIRPQTPEGKCVSDADMCDALGANGILRAYAYGAAHGRPFFEPAPAAREHMSADEYVNGGTSSGVGHMFEKILRLKKYMLTPSGKAEAELRHAATVDFLDELFREEGAEELRKTLLSFR